MRRHVHRYPWAPCRAGPAGQAVQRLPEHPVADRPDQASILGGRHELGRAHGTAGRRVPAQKRLHPDGLPAGQREDPLVVKVELVALDGLPQGPDQSRAHHGAVAHAGIEDLMAGPAVLLGPIHRGIGVA